jgi:hypothetical protein
LKTAAEKKAGPLYCPPEKIGLDVANYIDLIEVGIKADHGATPRIEDTPIGMWLVQGLVQTFPCK